MITAGEMGLTEEHDRWNALVHEIGHALIAEKLGYTAKWQVYPAQTIGARTWEGATALPANVSPDHRAIIGLAGAVSEILVGVIPFSFEPSDLAVVGMLCEYTLSESDAAYIGDNCTREHALRCIELVRELNTQIAELAVANGGVKPSSRLCNGEAS